MDHKEKQAQPTLRVSDDSVTTDSDTLPLQVPPAEPAPQPGKQDEFEFDLGDGYEMLSLIGQGKKSLVYKVRDKSIDRVLAIKVFRPQFLKQPFDRQTVERQFKRLADLVHPHLVSVYDCGITQAGAPYLVMDYVDGVSLERLIESREHSLDLHAALDIFVQICEVLELADAKGVVHGALKPANVLLKQTPNGAYFAKLVELGTEKIFHRAAPTLEPDGYLKYKSPEKCEGGWDDRRSDIYSLGCIMYETVSGKYPDSQKLQPLPTGARVDANGKLEPLILRCLEQSPQDRFQTIHELIVALQTIRSGSSHAEKDDLLEAKNPVTQGKKHWQKLALMMALGLTAVIATAFIAMESLKPKATAKQSLSVSFNKQRFQPRELGKIVVKSDHDCTITLIHLAGNASRGPSLHFIDDVELRGGRSLTVDRTQDGLGLMVDKTRGGKLVAVSVRPVPDQQLISAAVDGCKNYSLPALLHFLQALQEKYPGAIDYVVVDEPNAQ